MERFDLLDALVLIQALDVECQTDVDVALRQILAVDEYLADLVGWVRVFALFGVGAAQEELAVAALNDRAGVGLDLVHDPQDLGDLGVERGLGAEEDVAVGVGGVVAVVHQLGVGADLAVVAGDELQEAQDGALVDSAEDEGRARFEQVLLHVLAEADQPLGEVAGLGLLDLPDVEVDEAHGEHVVGQEGELVLAVGVVGLEGVPQEGDVLLLLRALEGERQVAAQLGGFFHDSRLRRGRFVLPPDAGEGGLDLLLHAGDQLAVGVDQRLLGFDLGDDGALGFEGRKGHLHGGERLCVDVRLTNCTRRELLNALLKAL